MAFNTNVGKQSFTATAGQTLFTFNFKIYNQTDLKVYQTLAGQDPNDTNDILTYASEYTVVVDGDNGGTVTLLTGAAINDTIVIVRDLPRTRDTSYVTNGDLKANTINIDQDYQTYLVLDVYRDITESIRLPQSAVGVSSILPNVRADSYLKWNSAGNAIENDTTIPAAVTTSSDNALNANSYANEAEDVPVKEYTNGVPSDRSPTVYSALHHKLKASGFKDGAELEKWDAEAKALTSLSYAIEPEDTVVNLVTSDGDGTFTYTPQIGVYSSLHYAAKAATFNPALYALLTGATFTGQVKGITPIANEDLTRKDYVDGLIPPAWVANDSRAKTALNAGGSAPIYGCRAWINFNGTGTIAIRGSGNVSSIVDNGTGDYTINFTTALEDVNYSAVIGVGTVDDYQGYIKSMAVGSIQVGGDLANSAGASRDIDIFNVAIFR